VEWLGTAGIRWERRRTGVWVVPATRQLSPGFGTSYAEVIHRVVHRWGKDSRLSRERLAADAGC
jgi:hypothetical protein